MATLNVCVRRPGWVPILLYGVDEEQLRYHGLLMPPRRRMPRSVQIAEIPEEEHDTYDQNEESRREDQQILNQSSDQDLNLELNQSSDEDDHNVNHQASGDSSSEHGFDLQEGT